MASYDGSSSILKAKDTGGRTIVEAAIDFEHSLSSLPSAPKSLIEDTIAGLKTEVSHLKNKSPDNSIKKLVKRFFQKSLLKKEQNYPCTDCPDQSPFESFKAFQRHRKTYHSESVTSENLGGRDEYKCLLSRKKDQAKLCLKNIKKVDICRHLKLAHGEARPLGKEFKGFFSFDQKKFTVAWGGRSENFPDEEMIEREESSPEENPPYINNLPVVTEEDNSLTEVEVALVQNPQNVQSNETDSEILSLVREGLEDSNMPAEIGIQGLLNEADEAIVTDGLSFGSSVTFTVVSHPCEDENQVNNVEGSLMLTVNPSQITVSESENNLSPQQVKSSSEARSLDNKLLSESEVPEVVASEEITSSPPFYGFSQADAETMRSTSENLKDVEANLVQDVLLSSSAAPELDDSEDPEFDVVVPMELIEPGDDLASSLEYPSLSETVDEFDSPPAANSDQDLKEIRYHERKDLESIKKLSSLEGNSEFIEMFKKWLIQTSGDTSTLNLKVGHNFTAPDSFLNWFTSKCPGFTLMRLINFTDAASFISIPNPAEWLKVIGGPSGKEFPSRRHECVKAFLRLLQFIRFQLNQAIFDGDSIVKKRAIKEHIKDIEEMTKEMNYHKIYRSMAEEQKAKKEEMSEIVNPTNEEDKLLVSESWFGSDENKKINEEAETIWKKTMERENIDKKDFNRAAQIYYLETAMSDKSRRGVYNAIINKDWMMMKEVYLPAGYDEPTYEQLPKGWKIYEKPKLDPNAKPSRFEIRIPGSRPGIKNKQRQVITLNLRIYEGLKRYQDIKRTRFGNLQSESPFFCNYDGESLPPLRNYEGSLLNVVGRVTGNPNFTLKDTRKSLDSQIQGNPALRAHIKDLNAHSEQVGALHYDRLDAARRSILNHCINQKEGSDLKRDSSDVCEEIQSKRAKYDEQDRKLLVEEAKEFIEDEKKRQPKDLSPTALVSEDITILCSTFKDAIKGNIIIRLQVKLLSLINTFQPTIGRVLSILKSIQLVRSELGSERSRRFCSGRPKMTLLKV